MLLRGPVVQPDSGVFAFGAERNVAIGLVEMLDVAVDVDDEAGALGRRVVAIRDDQNQIAADVKADVVLGARLPWLGPAHDRAPNVAKKLLAGFGEQPAGADVCRRILHRVERSLNLELLANRPFEMAKKLRAALSLLGVKRDAGSREQLLQVKT